MARNSETSTELITLQLARWRNCGADERGITHIDDLQDVIAGHQRARARIATRLGAAGGSTPSKSGSHLTLRWRERDSNRRSPVRGTTLFKTDPFDHSGNSASAAKTRSFCDRDRNPSLQSFETCDWLIPDSPHRLHQIIDERTSAVVICCMCPHLRSNW
jgi:hypothetical protein